jgi:hypothetical protein
MMDPDEYTSGSAITGISQLDLAAATFFTYCYKAGPKRRPFYTGSTEQHIKTRFENLFAALNSSPVAWQKGLNDTIVTEYIKAIKRSVRDSIYYPVGYFPILDKDATSSTVNGKGLRCRPVPDNCLSPLESLCC